MPSNVRAFRLAQARVDIAANVHDARVRSQSQDLRIASSRRRADHRLRGEQIQRRAVSRDQDVARVVAIGKGHDRYGRMECGREVLRGVDCGVDLASQNRGFDRIGEHAPPADLRQGRRLVDVALGGDDLDLHGAPGMSGAETVGGKIGLGQGERAAASAKPDRPVRKRRSERHARDGRG